MARHPLATLRNSLGLSHPGYAQLVARTHEQLGSGRMAARREKISRWESGRSVPELTAQLAMAHIHQVDTEDVLRLGWPNWLLLATGDEALLDRPWTVAGAVDALTSTSRSTSEPSRLAVTGPVLRAQVQAALGALQAGPGAWTRRGRHVGEEAVSWIEARVTNIEGLEAGTSIPQAVLFASARAEYQLAADLLTGYGYDAVTGRRLLLLAARSATLCVWLSGALGEELRAERYALAALRAAVAAGEGRHTAAYLALLAIRHLRRGDPNDALALLRAARVAVPRPTPRLAIVLRTREARAVARLGDRTSTLRSLGQASRALDVASPSWNPESDPTCGNVDQEYFTLALGHAMLRLGRPKQALVHYDVLLGDGTEPHRPPSPHLAARLRPVVEAQLAVGDVAAAADTVARAVAHAGRLPPGLADGFRRQMLPHAEHRGVAVLLDRLAA
ncbi:hypothetical protein [Kitasatospora sp. LaBMicrA B282]|uniref:hypothetical protein n=1 Tax=Kitasatospora sp. LaBMicrA B282 TaxID=3420949 RepID=UPI003D0FF913